MNTCNEEPVTVLCEVHDATGTTTRILRDAEGTWLESRFDELIAPLALDATSAALLSAGLAEVARELGTRETGNGGRENGKSREWQIARLTGIGVELTDAALLSLVTLAERLRAEPDAARDLTSATLAAEQIAREEGAERVQTVGVSASRFGVLAEVAAERNRQISKWGDGMPRGGFGRPVSAWDRVTVEGAKRRHDDAAERGSCTMRLVLEEEVAEVFAEEPGSRAQRVELVQVAAVCVKWIEAIDAQPAEVRHG